MAAGALLISVSALADTCPNLAGKYVGDLKQDAYQIQQSDCSSVLLAYGDSVANLSSPITIVANGQLKMGSDGEFVKSSFSPTAFAMQKFLDAEGKQEAGPLREFSLYTTVQGTWLKVKTYLNGPYSPSTVLYKKQ